MDAGEKSSLAVDGDFGKSCGAVTENGVISVKRRIIVASEDPALPPFSTGESCSGFELSFQLGNASTDAVKR